MTDRAQLLERVADVLRGPGNRRGDQAWFTEQVVRLADWRPAKATISKYVRGLPMGASTAELLDDVLDNLMDEAKAILHERIQALRW